MERGSGCGEIRDGEGVRMWRDWRWRDSRDGERLEIERIGIWRD